MNLTTKPLIINGYEYKDYRILDLSTQEKVCISIVKINGNIINEIARTKRIKRKYIISDFDEKETIHFMLVNCFKLVKCIYCKLEHTALRIRKTKDGYGCMDCISRISNLEHEQLSIEEFVEDECCVIKTKAA